MLAQLLAALLGDAVFGSITARHRRFHDEIERYLDERGFVQPTTTAPPPAR